PAAECFGQLPLTPAIAVGVSRVEEIDPVDRVGRAKHFYRFFVGLFSPPAGREGPGTKTDLANAYVGSGKLPISHRQQKVAVSEYKLTAGGASRPRFSREVRDNEIRTSA